MTSRRSAHKDKFSLFGQSVQRELTTLSVASLAGSLAGSDISFPSTAWMQMNHCNSMNVEADCTISALCSIQADFSHVSGFYFHEPVAEEEQDVGNVIMSLTCSISFCRFSSLCFWEKAHFFSEIIGALFLFGQFPFRSDAPNVFFHL